MRPIIALFLTLLFGTAAGLGATAYAVNTLLGLDAVVAGPWTAWPRAGSAEAEPYALAAQARRAYVPLGVGEGLALFATQDSDGRALEAACAYTLSGRLPSARTWTLMLYDRAGRPIETPLQRNGFTAAEVVREPDGGTIIVLSPTARPGNWLQTPTQGPFVLLLRLYDTVLSANAFALDGQSLPRIQRDACP